MDSTKAHLIFLRIMGMGKIVGGQCLQSLQGIFDGVSYSLAVQRDGRDCDRMVIHLLGGDLTIDREGGRYSIEGCEECLVELLMCSPQLSEVYHDEDVAKWLEDTRRR